MKFDNIIMNPPYSKNLHLKILAKAIEKLDKNGTCVNLSPVDFSKIIGTYIGWNEDGKKNSTNWVDICLKHTSKIEALDHRTSNDLFNLGNQIQALGIWICKKSEQNVYSKYSYFNETFFKIALKFYKFRSLWAASSKVSEVKTKYFVDIYKWHGAKSAYESIICNENSKNSYCLEFNSNDECVNFKNSIKCWPYSLMFILEDGKNNGCKIWHLPWMGDVVNPRTGKKGYKGEWTNEDFYQYFEITEAEQKLIEKTMEKYR